MAALVALLVGSLGVGRAAGTGTSAAGTAQSSTVARVDAAKVNTNTVGA